VRQRPKPSPWRLVLAVALGFLIGTYVGRLADLGTFSRTLLLSPWTLDLSVVGVRLWVATNLLGLLGAALGLVFAALT